MKPTPLLFALTMLPLAATTALAQPAMTEAQPAPAAQPVPEARETGVRPWQAELRIGLVGDSQVAASEVGFYGGLAGSVLSFGESSNLFVGAGVLASFGSGNVDDRRGRDGKAAFQRQTVGPELRVGWMHGRARPTLYLFGAYSPSYIAAQSISEELPELGRHWGHRFTAGFAWPGSWRTYADAATGGEEGDAYAVLAFLLPNSIGLSYEVTPLDKGTVRRGGVSIGYSF